MSFLENLFKAAITGLAEGVSSAFDNRNGDDDDDDENDSFFRPQRFPDIDWYCDHCGAYLNVQDDFDDHKYVWKCTECGYKSSISKDSIL